MRNYVNTLHREPKPLSLMQLSKVHDNTLQELLDHICTKLGQSESETMRIAFLQYAEKLKFGNTEGP